MKKAIALQIKKLAYALPSFQVRSKQAVKYSGEYLLSVNTMEVDGKPVNPDSTYLVYPLHPVNHEANMRDIFDKEGMDGVEEYCRIINENFLLNASKENN